MTLHIYKVGEMVGLAERAGVNTTPLARYKIAQIMPAVGTQLQYRVKGDHERFERVVREGDIIALQPPPSTPGEELAGVAR
jgi:hypothetical protein